MQIEVKFSGTSLSVWAEKIATLGAQADVEMARGLNDGGKVVFTQVRRALKTQMGLLSYGTVVKATDDIPASPSRLIYSMSGRGKGLPIRDFPVAANAGGPVTASPWGVPRTFERSFVTSKRGLLRARRGTAREPIRPLFGPSPAKEIVKDQALATFEAAVPGIVEPTIMRRLIRLMP